MGDTRRWQGAARQGINHQGGHRGGKPRRCGGCCACCKLGGVEDTSTECSTHHVDCAPILMPQIVSKLPQTSPTSTHAPRALHATGAPRCVAATVTDVMSGTYDHQMRLFPRRHKRLTAQHASMKTHVSPTLQPVAHACASFTSFRWRTLQLPTPGLPTTYTGGAFCTVKDPDNSGRGASGDPDSASLSGPVVK